ncbi:g4389 [Coccomyxa elongata]
MFTTDLLAHLRHSPDLQAAGLAQPDGAARITGSGRVCSCALAASSEEVVQEGIREREYRLAAGFCSPRQVCASCTERQQRDELHERLMVPEVELDSRTNSWEAYAGRLVAEASSLEEDNALLTSQLSDAQADKWYLEIAKAGLEDRVAHLAAALVQAEGLSEQLDIKCAEQEQSLKALQARVDAAETELRQMAQLQRAHAVRLNMQLELCRDRRAREALERAIETLEDFSDELLTAPAGGQDVLRGKMLQRPRFSLVGTAAGCWPVSFGSRRSSSHNQSSNLGSRTSASAPASPTPTASVLACHPLEDSQDLKVAELLELSALRKSASFSPATPSKTEDAAREAWRGLSTNAGSLHGAALKGVSRNRHTSVGGHEPPILRADSAKEVPPKRRATGRSPSWSRGDQMSKPEESSMIQENASMDSMASDSSTDASAFALSTPSSGQCGSTNLSWVPAGVPLEEESEPGLRVSSHTALSMATTSSGRLAFAHSVMPMISDIGRQLAAQYAVGFEHGRV